LNRQHRVRWMRRYGVPALVLVAALGACLAWWANLYEHGRPIGRLELLGGLVPSLLLAALAWSIVTARERAVQLAERMTRSLRDSEQRWALAIEGAGDGLWDWHIAADTVSTSERCRELLGLQHFPTEPLPSQCNEQLHPDDRERVRGEVRQCLSGETHTILSEFRVKGLAGGWNWVMARGTVAERDANGRALRMIGTLSDINARRLSEERVRFMALHDPLTELANRAHFEERFHFALAHARRYHEAVGLILLDLDRFKPINDQFGHAVGDQLLQTVARRIRNCVRETDTVGRIGGDEFVVLLTGPVTRETARRVGEKIYSQVAQPMELSGQRIELTCSLGLAMYPEDGADELVLTKAADAAMYGHKRAGRQLLAPRPVSPH